MNVRCAVSSCPSTLKKTGGAVKYYKFPRDDGVRSVWTVRCDRRDSWNPSTSYICSLHFTDDDYYQLLHSPFTKKLLPDAVPSKKLKLFGWDVDEAPGTGTGTDMSDAEDPFIRSMIKTSSRRNAGASPRASHSSRRFAHEQSTYGGTSGHSETEFSEAESSRKQQASTSKIAESIGGQPKKKKRKRLYCSVLTCRAKRTKGFHYFPKDVETHQKWIDALFHGEPHHRVSARRVKCICRRHFTEDDYLDPPSSGAARRLARYVVPSINIPICRAEVRLARLKLHLDLNRRKPEERNLSFSERLMREPELYYLYQEYQAEVKNIDPARVLELPFLPANGEIVGPGEPAPGNPSFIPRKELKKIELMKEREQKKAEKEASMAEICAERRRKKLERKREYYRKKQELRKLLRSDPVAYGNMLAEDQKEAKQAQREHEIARRIVKKANAGADVQFGNKMAIVAEDLEKGAKFKVIIKKVIKRGTDSEDAITTERVLNPAQGAELFRKVISKVDVSGAKRIKFSTAKQITKKVPDKPSELQKPQQPAPEDGGQFTIFWGSDETNVATLGVGTSGQQVSNPAGQINQVSLAIEDEMVPHQEPDNDVMYEDDHHEDNYDDSDHHRSDNEMDTEDIPITEDLGGPDHSYTNKTGAEEVETPTVDPFAELQEQLRSMPEDAARMLVKEKMDAYRVLFKQQVARLRQLLRARQKTDRKFKCLTRILCVTLREQITKYYGQ